MASAPIQTNEPRHTELDRPLGLTASVALVVGGVIGIGIYVLIAQIVAHAGSAQWVAFTLAIVLSAIGVLPLIQIASALPVAGGGFAFTSRLLSPGIGTVASALAVLGGSSSTALVAWGMADYLGSHLPAEAPRLLVALSLPVLFFALYSFGLRLAIKAQALMALQLVLALLVYVIAGATHEDVRLTFAVELPQGGGGLILATVLAYGACVGFQVIGEMGEEMKSPSRDIPLSLLIGGAIILALYVLVGAVFFGSIEHDSEAVRSMRAPLDETGARFLSPGWVVFLGIGALSAGLTSLNAGAIALPREIFSLGRDEILPAFLGRVNARTRSPLAAVGAYFGLTSVLIVAGMLVPRAEMLDFYGVMTAVGILLMTAILAVAALRLPSRFPERYARAYLRLPRPVLVFASVLAVVSCLGFCALVLTQAPWVGAIYLAFITVVIVYYVLRVRALIAADSRWNERFSSVPGLERAHD